MPFGLSNTKNQSKLENKQLRARESRDEYYDLSNCDLKELPKGVKSQVKVFQKTVLILHSNLLCSLSHSKTDEFLSDLVQLDLHNNRFKLFPKEILRMSQLRHLDISQNLLRQIPDNIDNLKSLQFLNATDNKISILPESIGNIIPLQELCLDGNPLTSLPMKLGYLRNLKNLSVPLDHIKFPNEDVCRAGLKAIMFFLGKGLGDLPNANEDNTETLTLNFDVNKFEREQNEKQRRNKELHQQITASYQFRGQLALQAKETRKDVIKNIVEQENRSQAEIALVHKQLNARHQELVLSLQKTELLNSQLIANIVNNNESIQRKEALWEMMRTDNQQDCSSIPTTLTESCRQQILASMRQMLTTSEEVVAKSQMERKHEITKLAQDQNDSEKKLTEVLDLRQTEQSDFVAKLSTEIEQQKNAFKQLQEQKDLQKHRIVGEIKLVETELCRLTATEQNRKNKATDLNTIELAEQRSRLLNLLTNLLDQKSQRERELEQSFCELEEHRSRNQRDYWLIQYQQLMNKQPWLMLNKSFVDTDVYNVLAASDALDFAVCFQYHQITAESLLSLTNKDLRKIGVNSARIRKSILRSIETQRHNQKNKSDSLSLPYVPEIPTAPTENLDNKLDQLKDDEVDENEPILPVPSAPPPILARFESECCICQNAECAVIYLPCGHICTCNVCAVRVQLCPLCRTNITQLVQLSLNSL